MDFQEKINIIIFLPSPLGRGLFIFKGQIMDYSLQIYDVLRAIYILLSLVFGSLLFLIVRAK